MKQKQLFVIEIISDLNIKSQTIRELISKCLEAEEINDYDLSVGEVT